MNEAPSKPFKDGKQASQLNPAEEHGTQAVFTNRNASIVLEPGVGSFDFPTMLDAT